MRRMGIRRLSCGPLRRIGRSRAGDMFIFMLNIFFLAALIIIFSKLHSAFTLENEGEGVGTRQAALLHTYAMSEQMLLYVDEAARFAAYESLATAMENGGINPVTPPCPEKYAGYPQWTRKAAPAECFPKGGVNSTVYVAFKKEMQANLRKYLAQYPGFPAGITYDIILETGNGMRVIGITRDQVTYPIVSAKNARQQAITPILRQDGVAKTSLDFTPDTTLPAEVKPSVNGKPRIAKPTNITIQATLTPDAVSAIKQYTDGLVSTHYLIDEQGTLVQVLPEDQRSLGLCESEACMRLEEQSIIISLVNSGASQPSVHACEAGRSLLQATWCDGCAPMCYEPYAKAQLATLESLLIDIVKRTGIKAQNINLREQLLHDGNPGPTLRDGADQRQWLAGLLTRVAAGSQSQADAADSGTDDAPPASASPAVPASSMPAPSAASLDIVLPVDDARLTSCYGKRELSGSEFHHGIDFGIPVGTPVHAIADGVVSSSCEQWVGQCACSSRSGSCPLSCSNLCAGKGKLFGNNILIKHPNGISSHYAHLSSLNVKEGEHVKKGQVIGLSGNTGSSTAAHLHFSIYTEDVSSPVGALADNPLCIYPDAQLARIKGKPSNCPFTEMSHNDPAFSQACAGITPMKSSSPCGLNSMPLSAAGDDRVAKTLAKIRAIDGLEQTIQQVGNTYGIDARLLIAQITQESDGDPNLVSQVGALGISQFMPGTAHDYFDGNPSVQTCGCALNGKKSCNRHDPSCPADDVRRDPKRSVAAQAKLMATNIKKYDSYTDKVQFGLAEYNWGGYVRTKAIPAAQKETGKTDVRWEEVRPHLPAETQKYVDSIMRMYVAQGGSVENVFSDMECDNFNVKEMGTYSFAPAFTVTVPDLLTAVDRTAAWAKETYARCDDDTQSCLNARIDEFNRQTPDLVIAQCEEAPQAALAGLQQAIADCRENRQDGCSCAWKPTVASGVQLIITDNRGTPQPALFVPPTDDVDLPTGNFEGQQKTIIATTAADGTLTLTVSNPDGSGAQSFTMDELRIRKAGNQMMVIADASSPACGEHKTTYALCAQVKQRIPVLSKGTEMVTPKIKFALYLDDRKAPDAITAANAMNAGGIVVTFARSPSDDVSYYQVSCSANGQFDEKSAVTVIGRKDGKPVAQLSAILKACGGVAPIPDKEYKARIVPYDLAGNKGDEAIVATQEGQSGAVGALAALT